MKQSIRKISLIAAAVLALTAAAAAFAEEAGEPPVPAASSEAAQMQTALEAEAVPSPAAADESSSQETDAQALLQALEAYRTAKQAERTADLEKELAAYVENGSLTQEQADLILQYYQQRLTSHSQKGGRSANRKSGFPQVPQAAGSGAANPSAQFPAPGSTPGMVSGNQPSQFGRQHRFGFSGRQSLFGTQNGTLPADPGQNGVLN